MYKNQELKANDVPYHFYQRLENVKCEADESQVERTGITYAQDIRSKEGNFFICTNEGDKSTQGTTIINCATINMIWRKYLIVNKLLPRVDLFEYLPIKVPTRHPFI